MKEKINKNKYAKIIITAGMRGIGKTFTNVQECKTYTQEKKLPVLAYDINGDDYESFPVASYKQVRNLTTPECKRIVPFHIDPEHGGVVPMELDEQKKLLYYLLTNFSNGMLVLDDIDKYARGLRGQKIIGALTTCRHLGVDLMISHQSVAKISTTEWENLNMVRLHHTIDNVERIKERIPNYPMMRIAQIIVDDVYFSAQKLYKENKLTIKQYLPLRGYYVYVNFDDHKIYRGKQPVSKKQFDMAVEKFLRENPRYISRKMQMGDEKGKKLTRQEAIKQLINELSEFYGG